MSLSVEYAASQLYIMYLRIGASQFPTLGFQFGVFTLKSFRHWMRKGKAVDKEQRFRIRIHYLPMYTLTTKNLSKYDFPVNSPSPSSINVWSLMEVAPPTADT